MADVNVSVTDSLKPEKPAPKAVFAQDKDGKWYTFKTAGWTDPSGNVKVLSASPKQNTFYFSEADAVKAGYRK